ncbi:hypothetical protein [Halomonas cerina]|uniref:ABC-type sugar transport system substrate-binding protein n=1 Tax=Halomonas cerina TaxID=447424 RepID=A0A839V4G1_9GAMM|nr:hypothetical protein [Halomonas cerina]MBB3190282.1 ABC-type sugar transport system substrate-binding protein [Halomonas cerina]
MNKLSLIPLTAALMAGPAQGEGAIDTLHRLIDGEEVDNAVWIPFELVTPDNIEAYLRRN